MSDTKRFNPSRTEKERFRKLRLGLVRKAQQLSQKTGADVYVIIRNEEKCFSYNSTNPSEFPSMEELKKTCSIQLTAPEPTYNGDPTKILTDNTKSLIDPPYNHSTPDSPNQTTNDKNDSYGYGVMQDIIPSLQEEEMYHMATVLPMAGPIHDHSSLDSTNQITNDEDGTHGYGVLQDTIPSLQVEEPNRIAMVLPRPRPFPVCMPPMLQLSPPFNKDCKLRESE